MGPSGEAAIVGFNDEVDKLQGFTGESEVIEKTVNGMGKGLPGRDCTTRWGWEWRC